MGPQLYLIGLDEVDDDFENSVWEPEAAGLLAPSSWYFSRTLNVRPLSSTDFAYRVGQSYQELPSLQCVFTSQGVRIQLLYFDLTPLPQISHAVFNAYHSYPDICTSCRRRGLARCLALLRCEADTDDGSVVALPLCTSGVSHGEGLITATHELRGRLPPVVRKVFIRMSTSPSTPGYAPEITREVVEDPVSIRIAPTCLEELQVLGYTISPLRVTFDRPIISVQNLLATTTLSLPFRSQKTGGPCIRQDIHIGLVLPGGASEHHADLVSAWRLEMAHFTVQHLFHIPTAPSSLVSFSSSRPYISHESPLADSGHATRRADWASGPGLVKQAQAEFVLHADSGWELEETFNVRLLRITLEPDKTSEMDSERRVCHSLRLSIELSEPYQHDRRYEFARIRSRTHFASRSDNNGGESMKLSDLFDEGQTTSAYPDGDTHPTTSVEWAPATLNALGITDARPTTRLLLLRNIRETTEGAVTSTIQIGP
ncbi:hypothetical protein C8Q79DRAFT_414700 [Trametes meyenii]|nr:hypothetical protein C8Q79DRAFT_414700 [Trametes meyenii]